jgi:hypothetical protein
MKLTAIFAVGMVAILSTTSAQAGHGHDEWAYVLGGAIVGAAVGELIYDSRRGHHYGHHNRGYANYGYNSHSYNYYPRAYRSNHYYQPRRHARRHSNHRSHRSHRRHRSNRH